MTTPAAPDSRDRATWLQVVIAAGTGLVAFVISNLLQDPLEVTLGEQLILSSVIGGVTLLSEFLNEFTKRLDDSMRFAREHLQQYDESSTKQFESFGARLDGFGEQLERLEQNSARQAIETSALQTDLLNRFLRRASRIDHHTPPLLRDLAHQQIDRVSWLMRSLSGGEGVFYEGEDREWLLGLAQCAQERIMATSLSTVDAGRMTFEGGFWLNDLGVRYLDIQRAACKRGVKIQRIFVFDGPIAEKHPSFDRVRRLQQDAGIEIRGLDKNQVPEHLQDKITDFIVFDRALTYETKRASSINQDVQPGIVETRIVLRKDRIDTTIDTFDELWAAATLLPPIPAESPGVGEALPGEDVADPVDDLDG